MNAARTTENARNILESGAVRAEGHRRTNAWVHPGVTASRGPAFPRRRYTARPAGAVARIFNSVDTSERSEGRSTAVQLVRRNARQKGRCCPDTDGSQNASGCRLHDIGAISPKSELIDHDRAGMPPDQPASGSAQPRAVLFPSITRSRRDPSLRLHTVPLPTAGSRPPEKSIRMNESEHPGV